MQDLIIESLIVVIILALLVVAIFVRKKYPRPTDYYSFFWIGVMWIIVGILMMLFADGDYFFLLMGVIFAIIGLANKKKWKKNRVRWKDLKKPEKLIQGILIAILAFIIGAGIAFLLMRG
jgi:uncharacterized membrane protein YfcA